MNTVSKSQVNTGGTAWTFIIREWVSVCPGHKFLINPAQKTNGTVSKRVSYRLRSGRLDLIISGSVLTPFHCPFHPRFFGGAVRSNEESKKTERCLEGMRRLTTERDNEFMVYSLEINNLTAQSLYARPCYVYLRRQRLSYVSPEYLSWATDSRVECNIRTKYPQSPPCVTIRAVSQVV
jgi:hypothetical protein